MSTKKKEKNTCFNGVGNLFSFIKINYFKKYIRSFFLFNYKVRILTKKIKFVFYHFHL